MKKLSLLSASLFVFILVCIPLSSRASSITSTLHIGVIGEEVRVLQQFLATLPNIYPQALITGYFGRLTEAAVKKFQAARSIEPIGIVGPRTRAQINGMLAAASATGLENRSSNAQGNQGGNNSGTAGNSGVTPATPAIPAVPSSGDGPAIPATPATPAQHSTEQGSTTPPISTSTPPTTGTTTPPITATSTPPTSSTTTSTMFVTGDRIITTSVLNVRTEPLIATSTLIGTQASSSLGTIIGGPTIANGFIWWNVNYDNNPDGWSVEGYLRLASTVVSTPISTSTQPVSNSIVLQPGGGPPPHIRLGTNAEVPFFIQNLTCRYCDTYSPTSTAIVYYTPWYPNDGPQYVETGPHYYERNYTVPPIAPWDSQSFNWSGHAALIGRYYFTIVVDPTNSIGAYRMHRVEFYIDP